MARGVATQAPVKLLYIVMTGVCNGYYSSSSEIAYNVLSGCACRRWKHCSEITRIWRCRYIDIGQAKALQVAALYETCTYVT
jgi:hypothetical protein